MKDSREMPQKQTISQEGYFQKVGLGASDIGKALSISMASDNPRNGENASSQFLSNRRIPNGKYGGGVLCKLQER